jgi:hypothetical protein
VTFHDTQLGRFGELSSAHLSGHGDPDFRAAHALASDGVCMPSRPPLTAVLGSKLLSQDSDSAWKTWSTVFAGLLNGYLGKGGSPLRPECPKVWPDSSVPRGFCIHELTPPLRYWSMQSFASRLTTNTAITRADGTVGVDATVQPVWNYVITRRGEILVAPEDFGWIKHTSIAAGYPVWAAGQVGIERGSLRVVDVHSGHYVATAASNITPGSSLANELVAFVGDVVRAYFLEFALPNLHPLFTCVWG